MSSKPRLLDLFSGAGGAARGYQLAGFHVTGVDIVPQPRYAGDVFIQADALEYLAQHGHEYDAVHASPPCQLHSIANNIHGRTYPNLIAATRDALRATGVPWVIENVERAPLVNPARLCGTWFGLEADGWELRRHRLFEASFGLLSTPCLHRLPPMSVFGHGHGGAAMRRHGRVAHTADMREAMGISWMTRDELAEAIPPAYCEHVGRQLQEALRHAA